MASPRNDFPFDLRFGQPVVKDGCGVFGVLRKPHSPPIANLLAVEAVSCVKYRGSDLGAGYAALSAPSGGGLDRRFRIQAFVTAEEVARGIRRTLEQELGTVEEQAFTRQKGSAGLAQLGVWEALLSLRKDGGETLLERAVDRINLNLLKEEFKGRIFSYGNHVRIYKGVGYPLDVAKSWGLDTKAVEADLWLAHTRQPTNSPGTLPIWSHPFASMNTAIVHNGDISSFGANMELLGSWGLTSHVGTDSEVIARLMDHLVRVDGLSVEEAATVLINPFERDASRETLELLWRYRGAGLDGPFAVVGGYVDSKDVYLIALSDRSKFRPLLLGEDENRYYVASEENQIRNLSPRAKVWTPEPGSFFIASLRRGIIATGTRRSVDTQANALRSSLPHRAARPGYQVIDATGKGFRDINDAIVDSFRRGKDGILIENCAGQRYIGIGTSAKRSGTSPFKVEISGFPGNCLANLNDGGSFEILGNVADDLADTMHSGSVVVHGNARDVVGQALQGGCVFIRGAVGNRAAIQMREYRRERPFLIVGETADDYLGEYMAGGVVLVLDLAGSGNPVRNYVGTGMVGGRIYVRGTVKERQIGLPPKKQDVLNYLRESVLEGQISEEDWGEMARSEYLSADILSKYLPESVQSRVNFLFYTSRYSRPIVVEKRRLGEEDLSLIGGKLKEFFHAFSMPGRLLEEVLSSEFTIIRTKEEKPELIVPPQETPVEE